ncbi:MAG: amidohydrolase family protein [Pyrinomonadaceae bacterium]|nr:amidohydrolase family protein [Pyrinomonadaceae bacterium]
MRKIGFVFVLVLLSAAVIAAQTTAFVGVNVIPMDKERVLNNQTVIIRNGLIAEIGDAKKVKVPKDAVKIDGRGKFLIPGLVDMHTHLLSDSEEYPDSITEDELRVMVANGVTTIRFMIGTPEQLVLREKSAKGEIIAPTIFSASPHLTGKKQGNDYVVTNEQEARIAVRKSKQDGYDFIKVTTFLAPEVYEAIVDEAAKQNIRVVGHADSRSVGLRRALKARQQIEHLDSYLEALLPENSPIKGSVSDLYIYNPKNWESLDVIDESKIPEIAKATVAANPFSCPTQHFMKNTFGLPRSEESIRAQPDFRFYPKKVQEAFINFHQKTRLNEVSLEKRAKWVSIRNKIIKAIFEAGGKIMTGSDTPEFLWLYGFTMHREMQALREAGLTNYAVLEAATKNPSMFFGTLDKVGTIVKGQRADLVLLDANPLENIANTEKRAGVLLKGRYFSQTEMNQWLDEIAPKFQKALDIEPRKAAAEEVYAP